MKKSPEAVIEQAIQDLIMRDAEPLIQDYASAFLREHGREPTKREVDKAADQILERLTADKSRYHYSNLRPVGNPDGKTWRLDHTQGRN